MSDGTPKADVRLQTIHFITDDDAAGAAAVESLLEACREALTIGCETVDELRGKVSDLETAIKEWAESRSESRMAMYEASGHVFSPVPSERHLAADHALRQIAERLKARVVVAVPAPAPASEEKP